MFRFRAFVATLAIAGALGMASSLAADLAQTVPVYTKAPDLVPVQDWTGFYVGVNGGYGWSGAAVSYTPNDPAALAGTCGGIGAGTCIPSAAYNMNGAVAGGQLGYNWQMSPRWLAGIETDFQWSGLKGSGTSPFHLGSVEDTAMLANESVKWFGTFRGRLGFMPSSPLLIYATGGLAYGHVTDDLTVPNLVPVGIGADVQGSFSYVCGAGGPACFAGLGARTLVGYAVGAGGEYMMTKNISVKAEYLYVNLGSFTGTATAQTFVVGTTPASFTANFGTVSFSVARAGLNFRF